MKQKNLVSGRKASIIKKELKDKFGLDQSQIVKALEGNEASVKALAQMGIDGRRLQKYAPMLAAGAIDSIRGTDALNKMWADIYAQTASSAIGIESEQSRVHLLADDLVDQRLERSLKFTNDLKIRAVRHSNNMESLILEAEIAEIEMLANHEYRMEKLNNKLPMKQMQADLQYKEERIDHLLQNGDNSKLELIAQKRFTGRSLIQKVVSFFSGE